MVGTVDGSTVDLTEVSHDNHADGRHQGIVSDDGSGMASSFIGHTNDYTMAFDSILARSDTAPNADPRSCDVGLVGTWKSIQDVTIENLDADGGSLSTTFPEVNFTIDGQSENGCGFWGILGILSLNFGGVVLPDGTTLASSTKTNSGSIKGISNAHIIKSNDGGDKNLISFTQLSRSQNANSGSYFTTIFEKQSMNGTSYTPPQTSIMKPQVMNFRWMMLTMS